MSFYFYSRANLALKWHTLPNSEISMARLSLGYELKVKVQKKKKKKKLIISHHFIIEVKTST
jgi:hypothetical protein